MNNYSFQADLLNKFSCLTPWIQALTLISIVLISLGVAYFIKETITHIVMLIINRNFNDALINKFAEKLSLR